MWKSPYNNDYDTNVTFVCVMVTWDSFSEYCIRVFKHCTIALWAVALLFLLSLISLPLDMMAAFLYLLLSTTCYFINITESHFLDVNF
jgi:hypothetical protein